MGFTLTRAICLQCGEPTRQFFTHTEPPWPTFDLATSPTVIDGPRWKTVTAQPCGHTFGVRVFRSDGTAHDIRSDPQDELPAEAPKEGTCQRCGRYNVGVGWCCGLHHWVICARCVVSIADALHAMKRARPVPGRPSYEIRVETVLCPTAEIVLPVSDRGVPVVILR